MYVPIPDTVGGSYTCAPTFTLLERLCMSPPFKLSEEQHTLLEDLGSVSPLLTLLEGTCVRPRLSHCGRDLVLDTLLEGLVCIPVFYSVLGVLCVCPRP